MIKLLNTLVAATSAIQTTQTTRGNPDHLTSYFDEMVAVNTTIKSILLAATVVIATTVTISVYATNNDESYRGGYCSVHPVSKLGERSVERWV